MESDLDRVSPVRLTWRADTGRGNTIHVVGDLDRPDGDRLAMLGGTVLRSGVDLEIDLSEVGIFGSAAIRAIETVGRAAARGGRTLRLVNRPGHVDRVLDALGLDLDVDAASDASPPSSTSQGGRLLITSADFDRIVAQGVTHGREAVVITTGELEPPGPQIVFVNRAFTDLTGYSGDEVLGDTPRVLQGELTDRRVLERLKDDVRAGRTFTGEAVNYRRDGSPFMMSWRVIAVSGSESMPDYLLAMQSDVTELRRLSRFETALTFLDSQSSAMTAASLDEEARHQRMLESLVAAEVSLMGGGQAVARLHRRGGGYITASTDASLFDAAEDGLFGGTRDQRRVSSDERSNSLSIRVQLRPSSEFTDGEIVLVGMHQDRLAMADARLHEQLASHAAERGF